MSGMAVWVFPAARLRPAGLSLIHRRELKLIFTIKGTFLPSGYKQTQLPHFLHLHPRYSAELTLLGTRCAAFSLTSFFFLLGLSQIKAEWSAQERKCWCHRGGNRAVKAEVFLSSSKFPGSRRLTLLPLSDADWCKESHSRVTESRNSSTSVRCTFFICIHSFRLSEGKNKHKKIPLEIIENGCLL